MITKKNTVETVYLDKRRLNTIDISDFNVRISHNQEGVLPESESIESVN